MKQLQKSQRQKRNNEWCCGLGVEFWLNLDFFVFGCVFVLVFYLSLRAAVWQSQTLEHLSSLILTAG